jgi:hypothetical protein
MPERFVVGTRAIQVLRSGKTDDLAASKDAARGASAQTTRGPCRVGQACEILSAYLAGGLAVALQLGHRASADFDWFTANTISPEKLLSDIRATGFKVAESRFARTKREPFLGKSKASSTACFAIAMRPPFPAGRSRAVEWLRLRTLVR